jgi:hypothetical protein
MSTFSMTFLEARFIGHRNADDEIETDLLEAVEQAGHRVLGGKSPAPARPGQTPANLRPVFPF